MDVKFVNAYTEVVVENFDAVIKQNMILQAKLRLGEIEAKEREELEVQFKELLVEKKKLEDQVELLNATVVRTENVRHKAGEVDSLSADKTRIQVALNDSMRENRNLKKQLDDKETEIGELSEYIKTLEGMLPVSKLKKVNPEAAAARKVDTVTTETVETESVVVDETIKETTPIEDIHKVEVQSGGTF